MIKRRNLISYLSILMLIIGSIFLFSLTSCGLWGIPVFDVIVENHTEYKLTIYMNDYEIGNVEPGDKIHDSGFRIDIENNLLMAKDTEGEIIFSKKFDPEQLERINRKKVWKVVIPPQD